MSEFDRRIERVEAFRWGTDAAPAWFDSLRHRTIQVDVPISADGKITRTLTIKAGDYVVRAQDGTIYTEAGAVFTRTHDPVAGGRG